MDSGKRRRRRGGAAARRRERATRAARGSLPPGGGLAPDEELEVSRKGKGRTLVIACGALAREILHLKKVLGKDAIDLHCLPADWHNTPGRIADGVRARIRRARAEGYDRILVGYADCGTGGGIDAVVEEEGVGRLPGAHCYAFYTGADAFMENLERDARSFFLTDYLVRHFDTLVWKGMMLDRHPELVEDCFGNYEKLVYLAQTEDPELTRMAEEAAGRLGLDFERRFTGYGDLERALSVL